MRKRFKPSNFSFVSSTKRHLRLVVLVLLLTLVGLLRGLLLVALLVAGLVHLVEEVQAGHLELVGLLLDLGGGGSALARLALGNEFTEGRDLLLDSVGLGLVELVGILVESTLSVIQDAVSAVGGLNSGLAVLVSLGVLLGVLNHLLDLVVGETRARSDGDGLVLVGGLILGMDVDNRVGVNVKGDFNLRNATVGRGNANELEVSKELVVPHKLTLTLVNLDLDSSLEISGGGEDLGLLGRNGGVTVDQTGEHTTQGLNTEGQGSDIEEQEVLDLTREHSALDSGTDSDSLIRVDGLGRVTAKDALDRLGNLGHTSHTTDEDNLLDILGLEVGVLEGLADGVDGAGNERVDHLLKLSSGELHVDVLGARRVSGDEGKVDVGLERRGQLDLGLLSSLTDTLDSHAVTREVNARSLLEVLDHVTDEVNVEVLATKVGVTVGSLDLEDTALDLQNRDIESTTAKIVHGDDAVSLLLKTVSQSSGGGLVNDTKNIETGNLTGILGALTLRVVEVGRDGDDGVLDLLGQVSLGSLLHLVEDEATDLGGRVLLATSRNPGIAIGVLDDLVGHLLDITLHLSIGELAAYQTLGSEEGVLGINDSLALGGDTNEALAILGKGDD